MNCDDRAAVIDLVDRAYGEDHLRECMGYKSFGERPCDCIIGDLCDEIEVLRGIVRKLVVGPADTVGPAYVCAAWLDVTDDEAGAVQRALGDSG